LRKTDPSWVIVWVKRFVSKRVQEEASGCSTNGPPTGSKLRYDREKPTTQMDNGCRLVDDRVPADRERVPPHHWETDGSINRRI